MPASAGAGIGTSSLVSGVAVTELEFARVVKAIRETPIVDNHAHPLLKPACISRHPLLSIVSEAHGESIGASVTSLPHHRAVRQLSDVLGCAATWDSVVASIEKRRREDYTAWVKQCLGGLETILLDDGLDNDDDVFSYSSHNRFTNAPCRRIVRIEALAAEIIDRHCEAYDVLLPLDQAFNNMLDEYDMHIKQAISDPDVVAFKSIICYRTGLVIPRAVDIAAARKSFSDIVTAYSSLDDRFRRLQHVGLSDLFVHRAAVHIRDDRSRFKKPIQFHTGLGDNDITLTKASPAHLQDFVRTYSTVPIVLLHSGYPHMRDAGYLATVYANVYVDMGEVFPIVSRSGQEAIVREMFDLCPWNKVMWSTDGHWFPETYLLAILQVREVLESVIGEFVRKGDLGWRAAVQLVQDIFFQNANRIYRLGLDIPEVTAKEEEHHIAVRQDDTPRGRTDLEVWDSLLRGKPTPDFVRVAWMDYSSMPRMRMIPFRRFDRLVRSGGPLDIGITEACLGLLQHDVCIPGVSAAGEYRLHPDLSSFHTGPIDGHVSMNGHFRHKDGSSVFLCPRTRLAHAVAKAAAMDLSFLVGFEIEFVLVEGNGSQATKDSILASLRYSSNRGHSWSSSRFYADTVVPRLLRDIVADLAASGIEVEQVHAESAPGQFELILPAKPPMEAVDALLHARETIAHRATEAGYKFTLHPKPVPWACGTASHIHLSLATPDGKCVDKSLYEAFYAGILLHLPALTAFTYSNPTSYERLGDSVWAGGRWVAWGTQNRETPLRKIDGSHWEIKCVDGLANPYLVVSALILTGLAGIDDNTRLSWADCTSDPALLKSKQRTELGIDRLLPTSLNEALRTLTYDDTLCHVLGEDLVARYVAVKNAELRYYGNMPKDELDVWVLDRY